MPHCYFLLSAIFPFIDLIHVDDVLELVDVVLILVACCYTHNCIKIKLIIIPEHITMCCQRLAQFGQQIMHRTGVFNFISDTKIIWHFKDFRI